MDESTIRDAIIEAAETGPEGSRKITCARAFEISRTLGVSAGLLGEICNRENIRIKRCQLGCFE